MNGPFGFPEGPERRLKDFLENIDKFPDGPPECPFGVQYKWKTKGGAYIPIFLQQQCSLHSLNCTCLECRYFPI